ncbi:MAG: ArsR family transcriptional regulator [Halioglobus sp.]|jgi:ArsR family transcriptional regulator
MNIDAATVFSALANETRLRCLYLVLANKEVCVCEFVEALGIPQPAASKALGALKSAGLLSDRKEANWNYFSLSKAMPLWMKTVVTATGKEQAKCAVHILDQRRFETLDLRAGGAGCG